MYRADGLRHFVWAYVLMLSATCVAQTASTPPDKSGTQVAPATEEKKKENGKMFGIMPNYGTVNNPADAEPLTAGDKFKLALRYFSPYTVVFVGMRAGIDQALDEKHAYGQGAEGYGKRYGADFGDGLTNSFFVTGFFPSLLHQDPRYFRRGEGSGFSRITYAATRVLITRQDSGRRAFNFSELLGNAASAGISTTYYPEGERSGGDFAVRAGVQFGFDAGFNIVKEFYPDIARKFKKKSKASSN